MGQALSEESYSGATLGSYRDDSSFGVYSGYGGYSSCGVEGEDRRWRRHYLGDYGYSSEGPFGSYGSFGDYCLLYGSSDYDGYSPSSRYSGDAHSGYSFYSY